MVDGRIPSMQGPADSEFQSNLIYQIAVPVANSPGSLPAFPGCHDNLARHAFFTAQRTFVQTTLREIRVVTMRSDSPGLVPVAAALKRACFLVGARKAAQFPPDQGAEVAFAGRSNAGKSSALNTTVGLRSLARTSKTPGRTREVNFFGLDDGRRVVDLPGYGYARVSDAERRRWEQTVARYVEGRRCLRGIVLVMDVRHPFTDFDEQFLDWCHDLELSVHVLLTKADKLSKSRAQATLLTSRQHPAVHRGGVSIQLFSAHKRHGVEALQARLAAWLELGAEFPTG